MCLMGMYPKCKQELKYGLILSWNVRYLSVDIVWTTLEYVSFTTKFFSCDWLNIKVFRNPYFDKNTVTSQK